MGNSNRNQSVTPTYQDPDHDACGVAMVANIPGKASHEMVQQALHILRGFQYRSGYNPITGESDGAGIKFYGLSTAFFQKKIRENAFIATLNETLHDTVLQDGHYCIGHYFLPTDVKKQAQAKALIESCAKTNHLKVIAWRNVQNDVSLAILSERTRQKMPAIWQAIWVSSSLSSELIERNSLTAAIAIYNQARKKNLSIDIISQSSEAITYKGMLRAEALGDFFHDLHDVDFSAYAFTLHARFATNTKPQWSNAQPCVFFLSHNGELNSAMANAAEMTNELNASDFNGIYPNNKLSDSMQFDADLANQMIMKNISLYEAFVRLMSPSPSEDYSAEINAMLSYFRLERTSYNGPAFGVAASNGYFMAKLDSVGLRPSRWAIIEERSGLQQLHTASDSYFDAPSGGRILHSGHLEPGSMLMLTPEGKLLYNAEILELICQSYQTDEGNYFQNKLKNCLINLSPGTESARLSSSVELMRILYSTGWDNECVEQDLRPMADTGDEKKGAMGDDLNPLLKGIFPHFFIQDHAQVSSPSLDSIKERGRFTLTTALGATPHSDQCSRQLRIASPFLGIHDLLAIEQQTAVKVHLLDSTFTFTSDSKIEDCFQQAIRSLVKKAEQFVEREQGGILIITDRNCDHQQVAIPDIIAVAAVKKHLEHKALDRKVSIVADSYQICGPHQTAVLLAMGAKAVYARGAYAKILELYEENASEACSNYKLAQEKCLLKTMGKIGITEVDNYINGHFVAALGLDLSYDRNDIVKSPSLANIFCGLYSPLKGIQLKHVALQLRFLHQQAYQATHLTLLPRSGFYMPEKGGMKHGYGHEVVNAFTIWMQQETITALRWRLNHLLQQKGFHYESELAIFTTEQGFLNPNNKVNGFYPDDYLESFRSSADFTAMCAAITAYQDEYPTAIHEYFAIQYPDIKTSNPKSLQSQKAIRSLFYSGSMSQGALTVANPDKPDKLGAHETLTRALNAVGAKSAAGEGGEAAHDLRNPLTSTSSKQIASGRFGVSAMQIRSAYEIEIKIAQGAKPGEGGELPGNKVSIRIAAQRRGLPRIGLISPPPHHDIYSIEDLEELITDIKAIHPQVRVAVKLVASKGIGTIAVGVAKAGADVINIASHSGGTAAAQQSSIKFGGLPAELGLREVDRALRLAGYRNYIQLRVSGGFKTPKDVLVAAILGADLFEFGTTAMLTLGCIMQRTCNHSCEPGVATDGHLFKSDQIHAERYFVNLAASVQAELHKLGVSCLDELRGKTHLLVNSHPNDTELFDFSYLLDRSDIEEFTPSSTPEWIAPNYRHEKIVLPAIEAFFNQNPEGQYQAPLLKLDTSDRSFGARITGQFVFHLQDYPKAKIHLQTTGNAGQSYACFASQGMYFSHEGFVQDGCGKSMSGGELIIRTPNQSSSYHADENSIAGNDVLYGASGGKIFINGVVGHRFGILLKGAQVVVEGVGDLACEYMTSGTVMIVGHHGKDLATGALGGIIFVYGENPSPSPAVRIASAQERTAYKTAIKSMLKEHVQKTDSLKTKQILEAFDLNAFKVLIPLTLDNINNWQSIVEITKTYAISKADVTIGLQVFLEQKALFIAQSLPAISEAEKRALLQELKTPAFCIFSKKVRDKLALLFQEKELFYQAETTKQPLEFALKFIPPKRKKTVTERLHSIRGELDDVLQALDGLQHLQSYVATLGHDAQGCSGCRAQSCSSSEEEDSGCPIGKPINTINTTLKRLGSIAADEPLTMSQWKILRQAFEWQIQESPFIAYTGSACPAPCQDACTEGIPSPGGINLARDGKPIGEAVHIKDIEFYLFQLGRALGWFDGKKDWSHEAINAAFGKDDLTKALATKQEYDDLMQTLFKAPFRPVASEKLLDKELVIIGSGPAAMQIAFEGLRDGLRVRMYEKSNLPGGLLVDGIPAHKFDKRYLAEDFAYLQAMGLELHLNSEVFYDPDNKTYHIKANPAAGVIAQTNLENQRVVVCVGAGRPISLPDTITKSLSSEANKKIIQAADFLKALNEVQRVLEEIPERDVAAQERAVQMILGEMSPRNKKIVVIGGGDTAQDVIRWVARYFNTEPREPEGARLHVMVRGPVPVPRAVKDAYPFVSQALTPENILRNEEIHYLQGTTSYLVRINHIDVDEKNKLRLRYETSHYKCQKIIEADAELKELFDQLPRENRLFETQAEEDNQYIEGVDMLICALGFELKESIPLIQAIQNDNNGHYFLAGDVSGVEQLIIVGAQANARNTYSQIRNALNIASTNEEQEAAAAYFGESR